MNKKVDSTVPVGIAGLGRSGWNIHASTFASMKEKYRIVAACDIDQGRQAEARDRFGCRVYSEFTNMLRDDEVELVVVATPSNLHADFSIEAMRAGKHVLVEKPFAIDLDGADRMLEVAKETGQILTCNQNYRYVGSFLKAREVIQSGKLGSIILIRIAWHRFRRRWDWQTIKEFGGGNLNNDGSHVVDQALLLFGDAEPEVFCRMEQTPLSSGDAEDHVKVIIHAPGAPMIDMEFSDACAYPQGQWLVMGTQGGLVGDHGQIQWKYFDPESLPQRPVSRESTPDRSYNKEDIPWIEEKWNQSDERSRSNNVMLYDDVYATLRNGAPLAVTPESVRRQIAVLEKCRELSPV